MKNLKRILFLTFALLFVCSVPITSAQAASKITAKDVLKKAMYCKTGSKDQIVVSLNVNANIDTKDLKEQTEDYMHGNSTFLIQGKDHVRVMHYKDTTGDSIDNYHYYEQYESKNNILTGYTCEDDSNTYTRTDNVDVGYGTNMKAYDYKKMYKYMSDIKFVKKNTVKNGQKAYCVSAKFDCAKYLSNEVSFEDGFTLTTLTLYPKTSSEKNVYAKMTAYIDQKTGKMISMKFDMNQYLQKALKEQLDLLTDYPVSVKASKSYIMFEFNPSKVKKITMPSNYKQIEYNEDGTVHSETTYKKNKKTEAVQYTEEGYISSSYDKQGTLISEIETNYADEYSTSKQYENGKLTNTTQIDRADSITVSNVKQFLDAIGKYNLIYLNEGEYNLSDKEAAKLLDNPNVYVNPTFDGSEYILNNVDHLTLIGKGKVSIVIEPRYSTVINIMNSKDVTLKNLTIGHTTGKGECEGGVLYFENSSKITIDSCNLYGCGILGITTYNVNDLKMTDSQIYDCTTGIMSLTYTTNAKFTNCKFRDNAGYDMIILEDCTSITYDTCQIYNNTRESEYWENFIVSENNNKILFKNCDYHDNTKEYNLTNDDKIEFKDCNIK